MPLFYILTVKSPLVAVCTTEHNVKKLYFFHVEYLFHMILKISSF